MRVNPAPVYFQLFDLPVSVDVDPSLLAARYRERQQAVHPDRHAGSSPGERLRAVQLSSDLNEAYQCLRHPLQRAVYLLSLAGLDAASDRTFRQDMDFLQQQMHWREALADASSSAQPQQVLDTLFAECERATRMTEQAFREAYGQQEWEAAMAAVGRWQFLEKFRAELDAAEERLLD
ncbi:MAG: Fe-S protein assembly co-chaperone HscB [Gammaproteobacteria bacterium]|nr:MAG: Fe-S protein assembly co-chaperone HscB [Gammaproteobacteria bacterium]